MPVPNRHPSAGKPWTPEDVEALRSLAASDTPSHLIAKRLGRSQEGVTNYAAKHGIALGKNRAALKIEREEARRNGGDDPPQA